MSYSAARLQLGALSTYRLGVESYDPDKLGLGPLMMQYNAAGIGGDWAGPLPIAVGRPMEASTAIQCGIPWVMQWSNSLTSRIDWAILAETSSAAATRRFVAFEYDRLTGIATWKGFITVTFPTATAHTIRALRVSYDKHTAGTVAVSGTAVTGTGTSWQTDRACVGNRIGFGSTDPTQIAQWYEISAIGSDGSITLTTSAGTIAAGTAYVIEDLRLVVGTTNATATNGGLFVVKGLRWENFASGGTAIPAATTVDNIRACYWLKSASTITETVCNGMALQDATSKQSQMCWLGTGTTTNQLFKFDIRAALTLTSGAATNAFQYSTAVSATLTGTASQNNNGRVAAPNHGPGSGADCYYFTTTTRIYRSKALSSIAASDATWLSGGDNMTEIPPGGVNTIANASAMQNIEYAGSIDKFYINNGTLQGRDYITQYRTDGGQMDRAMFSYTAESFQSSADSNGVFHGTKNFSTGSAWIEGGILYLMGNSTGAAGNILLIIPVGADWEHAASTNNRVITPRLAVTTANKFVQSFVQEFEVLGGASGQNLGKSPEPYRVYYRTSGISDNSGAWTLLDQTGDMSGVAGASYVQLMFEFRVIGTTCIPARISNCGVIYDADDSLPAEMQWNFGDSDNSNGTVGVTQAAVMGTLTTLTITYYRADTNAAVLVQDSGSTTNGTWQYWNGSAWTAGLGTNAVGTRRRFVPSAGLPVGVNCYAKVVAA